MLAGMKTIIILFGLAYICLIVAVCRALRGCKCGCEDSEE